MPLTRPRRIFSIFPFQCTTLLRFETLLQWVLLPVTSILYGTLAALNSQTRLLIGKYLDEFKLTHKGVKK